MRPDPLSSQHPSADNDARYRAALLSYFQRRTGSRSEAEDLTRKLFLRLVQRADAQGGISGTGFVFSVAAELLGERAGRDAKPAESLGAETDSNKALAEGYETARLGGDTGASGTPELLAFRHAGVGEGISREHGQWPRYFWSRKRVRRAGAIAALLAVLGSAVAFMLTRALQPEVYETRKGERRTVVLADASRFTLDEDTQVTVAYSSRFRDLQLLKGQAEFDVATDPLRPFTVSAAGRQVVATGTLFNVDLLDRQLIVTLLRGSVVVTKEVAAPGRGRPIALKPFERLTVEQSTGSTRKTKVDAGGVDAWRLGKLVFEAEPLDRAVARVNRYARQQIIIAAWEHARAPISGTFNAGDMDAFARSVTTQLPVCIEPRATGVAFVPR